LTNNDSDDETRSSQPTHWGFWGTIIWGTAISVFFIVLQIITILLAGVSRNRHLSESELRVLFGSVMKDGYLLSLITFVSTVVGCALVVGVVKLKKGSQLTEYLCIRPVSLKILLKWIGVLIGFLVLDESISTFLGRPSVSPFMAAAYATTRPVWTIWVAMIIAAPLFEETFFRGFLLKGLESSFMRPAGAVLVTAGLWAALHVQYDLYEIGTIFCLGLLFGAARVFTRSLLVPLGLHAVTNLIATIEVAILG
jgi:membrane protease YdiL (CAAX protease family)